MAAKRPRRERLPSPSSDDDAPPPEQRIDKCPIPVGKNVDLASFTFEAPSFHIEDYFVAMGWVSLVTLDEKVYPNIMKEFYKDLIFSPGSGITCLVRNKRLKITRDLIRSILHLEDCDLRIYSSKTIPHLEGYNPAEACSRVTGKHFEEARRLSSNQLTLPCRVLHNIISHIIVPRKGHLDEVNHFDVFLLDSMLVGRKLDFSYIMLHHMNTVHRGHRPMALPYGMILTKIFQHHQISFRDEVVFSAKPTDTIDIRTLKRMKIIKQNGQWVAQSKGFDDDSGPSTLPFEGGEEMDEDASPPSPPRPRSHRPSSSASGINEDQFNLLSGRIDSLTSTVDGMQLAVNDLHNTATSIQATVGGIQATVGGLQSSVDGITSMLHALHSYLGTGFPPPPPPAI
ncbi:Uncharacterized protein Adt_32729 [Abeliophyllum distichum]|uniref:Putative plant transposon protein domain-containing protein n=1 Tax=Abeliophyllum distichum TaxID=126358 RepID=A0ABD1QU80_9LAMI